MCMDRGGQSKVKSWRLDSVDEALGLMQDLFSKERVPLTRTTRQEERTRQEHQECSGWCRRPHPRMLKGCSGMSPTAHA